MERGGIGGEGKREGGRKSDGLAQRREQRQLTRLLGLILRQGLRELAGALGRFGILEWRVSGRMALPEEAWGSEKGRGTGAGTTSFAQALLANDKQLGKGAGWDGYWKEDSTDVSSTMLDRLR